MKRFSAAKAAALILYTPGTDSCSRFFGWFRKLNFGGFDKFPDAAPPANFSWKRICSAKLPAEPKPAAAAYRANIDGGSRGNPGPAA